jgi:hypothetical protein
MTQTPSATSPPPQRVRVEGVLDAVRASDASFVLLLSDGRSLPGRLVGRAPLSLARLLGRALLVFGTGHFGPTGELERIESDGFMPNDGKMWTVSPDDMPFSKEVNEEMIRRQRATRGAWPGDETDEQIDEALREIS